MIRLIVILAAGAASLAVAVPAAAQTYPYPYPQQGYPPQSYPPQQAYPPGYGYPPQGQGGIGQIINQLLGNRYGANDRYAVERCATAAIAQASAQYLGPYGQGQGGYGGQGYGYGQQGYHPGAMIRVTAITEVQRRQSGLRVSGLLDSRGGYPPPGQGYGQPYGQGYGYQNQGYAARGDLTFRCNVDYRGAVSNVRVSRNRAAYNRGY